MSFKIIRGKQPELLKDGTLGQLFHNDDPIFVTLERLWIPLEGSKGGTPNISCVPDGIYKLVEHESDRWGKVKLLHNPELDVHAFAHHRTEKFQRYGCIAFHPGSKPHNFEGCLGVGVRYLDQGAFHGITDTRRVCNIVNSLFENEDYLEISTDLTLEIV